MTDTQPEEYEPGTVDENTHGWAPDAPGTGEAKERVIEANQKAWEANDTQEAATGAARQGPDMTGGHVGESTTQRGEDVVKDEGNEPGRYDLPPQDQSQRPAGGSTSRSFTGVDPQETTTEDSASASFTLGSELRVGRWPAVVQFQWQGLCTLWALVCQII